MDVQSHKLELIQWLINLNDNTTIDKLLTIKNSISKNSISSKEYNAELDQAEQRVADGDFIEDDNLEDDVEKW